MLFIPGEEIEFEYPSRNKLGVPLEYVVRRVRVESVSEEPVPAAKILKRPLVRRGSLLLFAHDLDIDEPRKFYVESMRQTGKPEFPDYRLGIYEPDNDDEFVDWVGRIFRPTVKDRLAMRDAVLRFSESLGGQTVLQLAAFPVES